MKTTDGRIRSRLLVPLLAESYLGVQNDLKRQRGRTDVEIDLLSRETPTRFGSRRTRAPIRFAHSIPKSSRLEEMTLLSEHTKPTRIESNEHPIPKLGVREHRIGKHPGRAWLRGALPKQLHPFWRTLLGLLIVPPRSASFCNYHAEMMVIHYRYTPLTAQHDAHIIFRDTD